MIISHTGRVIHENYDAETGEYTPSMTLYELTIQAEDGDDTDAIAEQLNILHAIGEIHPTDFADLEWGFTIDTEKWEIELDALYVKDTNPTDYLRLRLS